MSRIFRKREEGSENWISISDMMSGLMMVFLFISIAYMINVALQKNRIKEIAVTYKVLQDSLYKLLFLEFEKDLKNWNAYFEKETISLRFESPDVYFKQGSAILENNFKNILKNFFPRYINILSRKEFKDDILEIRIEGHTSSEWRFKSTEDEAYFNNMQLSQDRTRSVLEFVLLLPEISEHKDWVKERLTANGLSSSKLIKDKQGSEDKEKSRRVEFRVVTNAERRIVKILEEVE